MTAITGLRIINQKSENAEDRPEGEEKREAKRRRMPLKATSNRLERVALHYLERYSSSSENLRRVLMRRVERSARAHGTDREEGAAAIDAIVTKFQKSTVISTIVLMQRCGLAACSGAVHPCASFVINCP